MTPGITRALLVAAGLCLAAPRPASACSTTSRPIGLTLRGPPPRTLPHGGVLPVGGEVYGTSVATAMTHVSEFRVTRDDVDLDGALEVVTIASDATPEGLQAHDVVLVWRPQEPLTVGDALVLHVGQDDAALPGLTVDITVVAAPTDATLPTITTSTRVVEVAEPERICCEIVADSCDRTSMCLPTRARRLPALSLQGARLPGAAQGYLWVARQDAKGEPGPPLLRAPYRYGLDEEAPVFATWSSDVLFTDAAPPHCVIVGVTSLVDGATVVADPLCIDAADTGALGVVELEPDLPAHALANNRECVSDPVYEADGSPYPREPASDGCRAAPRTTPPLVLLLLACARVRRRRGVA